MKSIISSKNKEIERLQSDFLTLQEDIKPLQNSADFTDLDATLNNRLNKLEKDIIDSKKEKVLRDKLDYDTNMVYVWKLPRYWGQTPIKHVSFSDTETDIVTSDSDQTTTQSFGAGRGGNLNTPNPSKNGTQKRKAQKKKYKSTKKQEGDKKEVKIAGGNRYPLRTPEHW